MKAMFDTDGNNIRFILSNTTNLMFQVVGLIPLFGDFDDIAIGDELKPGQGDKPFLLHGSQSVGTFVCCNRVAPSQLFGVSASHLEHYEKMRGDFCTMPGGKVSLTCTGSGHNPSCRVSLSNA
jgi:hypothetical protein